MLFKISKPNIKVPQPFTCITKHIVISKPYVGPKKNLYFLL